VERADTVILFSDVVESTRLTEELGAVGYRRLARQVEELVTSTITAHGGTMVTGISLGDGFIGLFPTVEQAVQAARRCAADVGATGLHLHLALHRGEILLDGARIYGGPVNYSARLCALSGPDEILVSEAVRDAASGIPGIAFLDRGLHDFKGFTGAQAVSALVEDTRDEARQLQSDD
jgi:class 3 adenylate cyclase